MILILAAALTAAAPAPATAAARAQAQATIRIISGETIRLSAPAGRAQHPFRATSLRLPDGRPQPLLVIDFE